MKKIEPPETPSPPKQFRLLKWDERVITGDFVTSEQGGFIPWEGPKGFRADAFIKPVYREDKRPTTRK